MTTASDAPNNDLDRGKSPARALPTIGATAAGLVSLLAASCCVLPIGLTVVGLGGSWLAVLGPFVVWRGPILAVAALVVAAAWFVLIRHLHARGPGCLRPRAVVATALATASLTLALSAPLWERDASRVLLSLYFDRPTTETTR